MMHKKCIHPYQDEGGGGDSLSVVICLLKRRWGDDGQNLFIRKKGCVSHHLIKIPSYFILIHLRRVALQQVHFKGALNIT